MSNWNVRVFIFDNFFIEPDVPQCSTIIEAGGMAHLNIYYPTNGWQ
jgi:hypothetical protein